MTARQALAFVRRHGVVLESARGAAPSLAEAIAGAPIRGNWWNHPKARDIFAITRAMRDEPDVLVCRLVEGKITFVHRRMWRQIVRDANRVPRSRLARLAEVHTRSGRHVIKRIPFPKWVPSDISSAARTTR